ncbi:DnaB-like helicase C-terminal domain-containing protein [Bacillus sp. JJ1122]|uniref:DnaB-like helicase C-terminal domain-containing protein n=1 Tax=Bacillus sp. JJ1122 TaxID=3122951 RepID=UPI002FFEB296
MDELTGGFQESDFVIISTRPSMGKTVLALNLTLKAAIKEVRRILVVVDYL